MNKISISTLIVLIVSVLSFSGCNNNTSAYFTGIIEGETYTVSTPVSEKLVQLQVREGDHIHAGQVVGYVDTISLSLQKGSLKASTRQMQWQEKELKIRLEQAEDVYRNSLDKYQKNLKLKSNEAVSGQMVLDLKLQVDKWEKEKLALSAKAQSVHSGIDNLKNQLSVLDQNIRKAVLVAPENGYVNKVYYEAGEYVPPMSPIVELVNLEKVWCYIYVSENTLPAIQPGQEITGTINGSEKTIRGKIDHISAKAEFTPKEILTPDNRQALVYAVKVSFENPDKILKVGMPINVTLK